MQTIINGKTANIAPNDPFILNKIARFEPPIINGKMPLDTIINGHTRMPVLNGCVLNLPLYHPACSVAAGGTFKSLDAYQHTATVTGATWTPQGRSFDGADDAITFSAITVNDPFTVEMWFIPQTDSNARVLIGLDPGGGSTYIERASATALIVQADATGAAKSFTVPAMTVGVAYHLCWTKSTNSLVYLNAVASSSGAQAQAGNLTVSQLGKYASGAIEWWKGLIGECRLYSRALSVSEITNNYLATKWRYN